MNDNATAARSAVAVPSRRSSFFVAPTSQQQQVLANDSTPISLDVRPALGFARLRPLVAGQWPLWLLLLLAAGIRCVGIDRPLLGNFATKNVVYAMIARNWATGLAPASRPTVDCVADGQRMCHLVEFPVSAYITGFCWSHLGGPLDRWGRGVSIVFSVLSVGALYSLARRWHSQSVALAASFALAISPVSVVYGQSFMLESSVVFFSLAAWLCWDHWLDGGRGAWLIGAAIGLALLFLTKIFMVVLLLPVMAQFWAMNRIGGNSPRRWLLGLAALVAAITPAALWYFDAYCAANPGSGESQHVYYSIRQSAAAHLGNHFMLASTDFYRGLLDDLTGPCLTPMGFFLLLLGFFHPAWRRHAVWLMSAAVLVLVLPLKFHRQNYYDLVVLPPLLMLLALGWDLFVQRFRPSRTAVAMIMTAGVVLSLRYTVHPAFCTPAEDRSVLSAARALADVAIGNEPVITMHGSSLDLLYYCNRPGFALSPSEADLAEHIDAMRSAGAKWLVVANLKSIAAGSPAERVLAGCAKVRVGDDFAVYELPPAERPATLGGRADPPDRLAAKRK